MDPVALTLTAPRRVELLPEAPAAPPPGHVRVRTLYSGISAGTELTLYRGTNPHLTRHWDPARRLFGPTVCTSLGPRGVAALRLSSYSPRAAGLARFQAGCAQVPLQLGGRALVDTRFIEAAHARGMQVHVWTVDTEEESTAMLDLGVDGIMTDRPAMLRSVLEKRGQWVPR